MISWELIKYLSSQPHDTPSWVRKTAGFAEVRLGWEALAKKYSRAWFLSDAFCSFGPCLAASREGSYSLLLIGNNLALILNPFSEILQEVGDFCNLTWASVHIPPVYHECIFISLCVYGYCR